MYPEYAEVNGKRYKINTDFRYALRCNEIAEDNNIGDFERALAIIYTLFGEEGLSVPEDYEQLLKMAIKYLKCGVEIDENKKDNKKPDIDFIEDQKYIQSSFKYDYNYDPYKMDYLHWYEFYNDLNNLSYSEFGACCILSRIRQIRNIDTSKIKDLNEKKRIQEMQKAVAIKSNKKVASNKQKESARKFYEEFFKK